MSIKEFKSHSTQHFSQKWKYHYPNLHCTPVRRTENLFGITAFHQRNVKRWPSNDVSVARQEKVAILYIMHSNASATKCGTYIGFFSVPIGMRSYIPWRTIRPHDAQRYGDINTHVRLKDKGWRAINRFCWVEEANTYTCKTHTRIHAQKEQCATFLVLVIVEWKALLWLPMEKKRLANSLSSALYFSTKT